MPKRAWLFALDSHPSSLPTTPPPFCRSLAGKNPPTTDKAVENMSGKTKAAKASKSNYFSKGQEIRRCNDMRVRIKTYCKQESITQPQLADKMGVTKSQMNSFMIGSALTGSEVYTQVHPLFRSPPCRSLPIFHNAQSHR